MKPIKKVSRFSGVTVTSYALQSGPYHREDGPALISEHDDGGYHEVWWQNDKVHRYGGPAIISSKEGLRYVVWHDNVSDEVGKWLKEHGYVWETMADVEKWELEMFMRTLG